MVAVPVEGRVRRVRRPSPPSLIAWTGVAAAVLWPGDWLSPGRVALLFTCLLPVGLAALTRIEQDLLDQGPDRPTDPRSGIQADPADRADPADKVAG